MVEAQKAAGPSISTSIPALFAWIGPPLVAAAFVALAWWTWGTWPDVLVDFGRELYVPWRLSEGAVLHRDVAWFNGPLSAHFNALLFETFGASLATLVWANLTLLALLTALVFGLLRALSDALAATVATLVMLAVCGFGQLVGIGNYNFVCPYSHELTHGLLLGLGALACLRCWDGRRPVAWVAASGLLLGLCFLTKAEPFLAALAGCATALGLTLWSEPGPRARGGRLALTFSAATLLPVAVAFALLARQLPAGEALRATLGAWPHVLGGRAAELAFYRQGMGLDAPAERLGEALAWTGRWLVVLAPAAGLGLALRRGTTASVACAAAALVAALGVGALVFADLRWSAAARPFPLLVLAIGGAHLARLTRDSRARHTGRAELALCVFALVLMGKMLLNARLIQYGFVLALPALLVVVVAAVGWLPALIAARGRAGGVPCAAAVGLLAVGAAAHLDRTAGYLAKKTEVVGSGPDAFRADLRGRFVNQTLEELQRRAVPGATLAVLPEGVMLNWLARRANPTPYVNFMPPELVLFGEETTLAAFDASPPDWVALVHKDTSEYGFPLFGPDYGGQLAAWIAERYVPVRQLGQPPLAPDTVFGILLLGLR